MLQSNKGGKQFMYKKYVTAVGIVGRNGRKTVRPAHFFAAFKNCDPQVTCNRKKILRFIDPQQVLKWSTFCGTDSRNGCSIMQFCAE
uniref:Uncharacterized protein n=1 Tax=Romanomermis culicivorax TaxID=13658 RepID=A0A915HL89_ROMCU